MRTLVILNQKGGSGKTTLATNLAAAAIHNGKQAVIADTDPQQSIYKWFKDRGDVAKLPYVISSYPENLRSYIDTAEAEGADYFIIDTPANASEPALHAARMADLILVPCRPTYYDLTSLERTIAILDLARKPAASVINGANSFGSDSDSAEEALALLGLTDLGIRIGRRVAIERAPLAAQTIFEYEPDGKAAAEYSALFKAIGRHFLQLEQQQRRLENRKEPTRRHVKT